MRSFAAVIAVTLALAPLAAIASPADDAWVTNAYKVILARKPDAASLQTYAQSLSTGAADRLTVINSLMNSNEFRQAEINALYQEYLHRSADPAGLSSLGGMVGSGAPLDQAASYVLGSPAYFALPVHGGVSVTPNTNDGFVEGLYQDLLGRPVDQAAQFFRDQLAGNVVRSQIALEVLQSNEGALRFQSMLARRLLHGPSAPTGQTLALSALAEITAVSLPGPATVTNSKLTFSVTPNTAPMSGRKATLTVNNQPFVVEQWQFGTEKGRQPSAAVTPSIDDLRMTIVVGKTSRGFAKLEHLSSALLDGGGLHFTMSDVVVSDFSKPALGADGIARSELSLKFTKISISK